MRHLLDTGILRPVPWTLAAVGSLACAAAFAQTPSNMPLDRQVDEAFRQVVGAPGDMGAGMRYAQLLVQAGNYEGGIAAMERLLLDPAAPASIRLELAVLYYRLGSYAMSESLLRQALDEGRLAGEQRTLAENLLRDVTKRGKVSQLDGLLMLGARVQTNPAGRTSQRTVLAAGLPVPVADAYQPKSDTDLQMTLRLDHRYDLGTQNEAAVVSSLVAQVIDFSSSSGSQLRVNQVQPYNLALAEVTSGIRFKPLPANIQGLALRPHLILGTLSAQGHRYLSNHGVGLDAEYRIDERTLVDGGYEYRDYSYASRIDVPDAKVLGGPDNLLRVRLSRELGPGRVLAGELRGRFHRTDRAYYDYDGYEMRLAYSASYASPLTHGGGYWTTTVWGGVQRRSYDAADPAVDPSRPRRDTEWRIGVGNVFPLADAWSLLLQLEHMKTSANLPNYRNRNTSLYGAVAYRF